MKYLGSSLGAIALLTTACLGQSLAVDFECQAPGAFPAIGGAGDCEGATGVLADVVLSGCTTPLPTSGVHCAQIRGNAPWGNVTIPRPIGPGVSELRIPMPTGTTAVSFDWQWSPGENGWGDGVDISVCDSAGNLLSLCVAQDDSIGLGCTLIANFSGSFAPTPAGAYLSAVAFNRGDTAGDPFLWIDDVEFPSACVAVMECQAPGAIPGLAGPGDCEGLTGVLSSIVATGCDAGMPSEGLQCARVNGNAPAVPHTGLPAALPRPAAAGLSELRVPLAAGTAQLTFDWQWLPGESGWGDGIDISVCDSAGNLLSLCVAADDSIGAVCTPVATFSGSFAPTPAGAYLSAVAYNAGDTAGDPTLWIDNVKANDKGPFELVFSSPGGPGTIAIAINNGTPNMPYLMPLTSAPGAFPNGWFFGLDISLSELFLQVSLGPPFIGGLDGAGHMEDPPAGGFHTLFSGFTVYGVAIDNIVSTNPSLNATTPTAYTIP